MSRLMASSKSAETGTSARPQSPAPSGPLHMPVLVDAVRHLDGFNMTRCTFFTVEAATSTEDWVALLRERSIPFLLFGVTAVIYRPNLQETRFTSPEQLDMIFDAIEDVEGLVVETAHVWLPNFLFEVGDHLDMPANAHKSTVERGAVWRVSLGLFQRALQFQREVISRPDFVMLCNELVESTDEGVRFSPDETAVFRTWSAAQLDAARKNYERQRDDPSRRVLSWRDESGNVFPG